MTIKTRYFIAIVTAGLLIASLGVFGYFAFRSYRKGARIASAESAMADGRYASAKALLLRVLSDDPDNERAVILMADIALKEDNPPEEAWYRYRAMRLNPLDKSLIQPYIQATIRTRNFGALAEFAEHNPDGETGYYALPPEAARLEKMIEEANVHLDAGRFQEAREIFIAATNLNYYAVAPMLAQTLLAEDRVPEAVNVYEAYLKRFPVRELAYRQAELLALGLDIKRMEELAELFPQNNSQSIAFASYVDCLTSFVNDDIERLAHQFPSIRSTVDTPFSLLMGIAVDLHTGERASAEVSYRKLLSGSPFLDFRQRARAMFRADIARRFAAREPAPQLVHEAELVLEGGSDFELERLILLARFQTRSLSLAEVEAALQQHPGDPGLIKLKSWMADLDKAEKQAQTAKESDREAAIRAAAEAQARQAEAAREALRQREAQEAEEKSE